ncbi:TPA: helix-turn-helix domain-containing protein [Klebsiella quasipneumoniae subsp. quasipneumoniae]|nr:helix-turn-helix domain-containing protein [Klebsiella quasipneumoniae subsp. quasipneumoniae]
MSIVGFHIKNDNDSFFVINKKNQRLDLKKNNHIAYLEEGCVTMHRIDDGLLTITIKAPAIIGLGQFRGESFTHYIRCTDNCSMWVMSADKAFMMFSKFNLWHHAYDILTKHLYMYFARDSMIQKSTVKDIVLDHIKKIHSFDDELRRTTSVYTYILSRNAISRSAVHKVVKELIEDGSLVMRRGKIMNFIPPIDR